MKFMDLLEYFESILSGPDVSYPDCAVDIDYRPMGTPNVELDLCDGDKFPFCNGFNLRDE